MADRRRINGPPTTTIPVFSPDPIPAPPPPRGSTELRKIFLKTSLTPPASGSAFLELSSPYTLKLTASVYGPRPLPPSSGFLPSARVSAELKFAPFSTSGERRGYVRDALERDLSSQLQTAIARSIRTSVYPKSGIDVFVTVLDCEGEEEEMEWQALAGAITCASAAVADAGIECVDLVTAGMAAIRMDSSQGGVRLDPSPVDGEAYRANALVAYLAARDEVSLVWTRGEAEVAECEELVDAATGVARRVRGVLNEALKERLLAMLAAKEGSEKGKDVVKDVVMTEA